MVLIKRYKSAGHLPLFVFVLVCHKSSLSLISSFFSIARRVCVCVKSPEQIRLERCVLRNEERTRASCSFLSVKSEPQDSNTILL